MRNWEWEMGSRMRRVKLATPTKMDELQIKELPIYLSQFSLFLLVSISFPMEWACWFLLHYIFVLLFSVSLFLTLNFLTVVLHSYCSSISPSAFHYCFHLLFPGWSSGWFVRDYPVSLLLFCPFRLWILQGKYCLCSGLWEKGR